MSYYPTEVQGGGTFLQLEGLNACCVSHIQSMTMLSLEYSKGARSLAPYTSPAEGQSLFCTVCGTTLIWHQAAWRDKNQTTDNPYEGVNLS